MMSRFSHFSDDTIILQGFFVRSLVGNVANKMQILTSQNT